MFAELKDKLTNALSSLGSSKPNNDVTFKILKELWDKAENKSSYCQKQWGFWEGELTNKLLMLGYFPDQLRSNANIIKPIVETIIKSVLDSQFTVADQGGIVYLVVEEISMEDSPWEPLHMAVRQEA